MAAVAVVVAVPAPRSKDGNAAGAFTAPGHMDTDTVIDCSLLCQLLLRGADLEAKVASITRMEKGVAGGCKLMSHGGGSENGGGVRRPLHCAAADGNVAAVRMLLAAGAAANAKDDRGCTPLQYSSNALVARALTDTGGEGEEA